MSDKLPKGWVSACLKDVAEINPRHPKNLADALPVTFTSMAGLSESKPNFDYSEERPLGGIRKGFTHFAEGDVLFAKITPCMENGKGAVAKGLRNGIGCGTTELHVVRPVGGIDPYYVYHFLHQDAVRRDAEAHFTGTAGQARVPVSFIEQLELPLAPLSEQRRIVAKLEKVLATVDTCKKRLDRIPVLLKRFRQAVLAAASCGRLTADWREENPKSAKLKRLDEGGPTEGFDLPASWNLFLSSHVFNFVTSGSRGWARYYAPRGAIFIRVGNLNHDSIELDLRAIQRVEPPGNAEGKRTKVQKGDILVSITADVGMIAFVDRDIGEAYINQHVALARPNGRMNPRYLAYFLTSANGGRKQFSNLQRGATKVGLGLDDIRNVWIACPPLPEQHEIVSRVEELFGLADQIEARYRQGRAHVERLTQAVLAKAFRGELAPQDANDEPAEKLLARIRPKAGKQ